MAIADNFDPVFPISVEFVQGEQPSDDKLTGFAQQTEAGLERISSGIGDLWGDNSAYNKLYVQANRPPNIVNLARLIGPASMLNPLRQETRLPVTESIDPDNIPGGVNEFSLPNDCGCAPSLKWSASGYLGYLQVRTTEATNIHTALNTIDPVVFGTIKETRADVITAGDYCIDIYGNVFTFTMTPFEGYTGGAQDYVTYLYADTYPASSMNVIPDFNQTTPLCNVAEIDAQHYKVTLPFITEYQWTDPNGNPLQPGDGETKWEGVSPANGVTGVRAYIPAIQLGLSMGLGIGDEVPDGFFQLWDNINSVIVEGLTFKISSDIGDYTYALDVSGATLVEGNDRYRVITAGTTITEQLAWLTRRFDMHCHDGPQYGMNISHDNLADSHITSSTIYDNWAIEACSPPSIVTGNYHPQYLCRYGWKQSVDPGQCDNAILGDLFIGADKSDYTTDGSPDIDSYNDGSCNSGIIYLGSTTTYISYINSGIIDGLYLSSGSDNLYLVADTVLVGDYVVGATSKETLTMGMYRSTTSYGKLIWEPDEVASTIDGFAFIHDGAVTNAIVQMGTLFVHGETNPQDGLREGNPADIAFVKTYTVSDEAYIKLQAANNSTLDIYTDSSIAKLTSSYHLYLIATDTLVLAGDTVNLQANEGNVLLRAESGTITLWTETDNYSIILDSAEDITVTAADDITITAANDVSISGTGGSVAIESLTIVGNEIQSALFSSVILRYGPSGDAVTVGANGISINAAGDISLIATGSGGIILQAAGNIIDVWDTTFFRLPVRDSAPASAADEGCIVFYENAGVVRLYARLNGQWRYINDTLWATA